MHDYTSEIHMARKHLNVKGLEVDDYQELDEFVMYVENVIQILNKQKFKKWTGSKRYKWGQHLSLLKAYNLLKNYENKGYLGTSDKTTTKYDIVIKARTDFTYKTINCYKKEGQYYKEKADNYINFDSFDEPIIKTSGVQFQQYNKALEKWESNKNVKINRREGLDFKNLDWKRDENNLFRIGDISLTTNRKAADQFFAQHLNIYLHAFLKSFYDEGHTRPACDRPYDRHDAVQGDIAYFNNIKVYKVMCRFFRLARHWDCKLCWRNTRKNGTVVFPSIEQETHEFIISEVERICATGKEPAPFG
jgi:hypothetical protein